MRILIVAILSAMLMASNGWAAFIGSISEGDGLAFPGGGPWADATLEWSVTHNGSRWVYEYTFSDHGNGNQLRDVSHVIIEVSETFTLGNIMAGTTIDGEGPKTYTTNRSNPEMPNDIWGIKWDVNTDTTEYSWTIISDRMPMWGDFYAKGGGDTVAYNMMFGTDTSAAIGNGNAGGWVLVPDTTTVPIPSTAYLLGFGVVGLMLGRRRKKM